MGLAGEQGSRAGEQGTHSKASSRNIPSLPPTAAPPARAATAGRGRGWSPGGPAPRGSHPAAPPAGRSRLRETAAGTEEGGVRRAGGSGGTRRRRSAAWSLRRTPARPISAASRSRACAGGLTWAGRGSLHKPAEESIGRVRPAGLRAAIEGAGSCGSVEGSMKRLQMAWAGRTRVHGGAAKSSVPCLLVQPQFLDLHSLLLHFRHSLH